MADALKPGSRARRLSALMDSGAWPQVFLQAPPQDARPNSRPPVRQGSNDWNTVRGRSSTILLPNTVHLNMGVVTLQSRRTVRASMQDRASMGDLPMTDDGCASDDESYGSLSDSDDESRFRRRRASARFRAAIQKTILKIRATQGMIPIEFRHQREREKQRSNVPDVPGAAAELPPGFLDDATYVSTAYDGSSDGGHHSEQGEAAARPARGGLVQTLEREPLSRCAAGVRLLALRLAQHPFFLKLGPHVGLDLARFLVLTQLSAGSVLFAAGEPAAAFYIVVAGRVRVAVDARGSSAINYDICTYRGGEAFSGMTTRGTKATCDVDSELVIVSHSAIAAAVDRVHRADVDDKSRFLRQLPFFHALDRPDLEKVAECFNDLHLNGGAVVSHQGEKRGCDKLFVVVQGECRIIKLVDRGAAAAPPRRDGRPRSKSNPSVSKSAASVSDRRDFFDLGRVRAGGFFGDCSLFSQDLDDAEAYQNWKEGPDYSVVTCGFARVYCAALADVAALRSQPIRECFEQVQAHLARVESAFSCDEILTLHDRTRQWRKTKKKVVRDCVTPRHADLSPPPQPPRSPPPRAPRARRQRSAATSLSDDGDAEEHVRLRLLAKFRGSPQFRGSPRRSWGDAPAAALTPIEASPQLATPRGSIASPRGASPRSLPVVDAKRHFPSVVDAKRHAADTESVRKARSPRRSWVTD
ncbi:hypothetical protein M885DRAFT_513295 [Pelagophyceae sp. CCMP2097]|nr:hypothetical protein M885DRAFT_513295 [Pelagophyceae sp. CCMP2097]